MKISPKSNRTDLAGSKKDPFMENNNQNKLTKWLNKLQQESWQLELVISGFSIFLILGAWQELKGYSKDIAVASQGLGTGDSLLSVAYGITIGACLFILINLVLHVLLRGIWISTIGLRYVSGDIDFDSLKLSPKFDRLLRRKVGSFDQYILQLENLCSVVFAFTFLIVFMFLAVGLYFGFFVFVINVLVDPLAGMCSEGLFDVIEKTVAIVLVAGGLLYFVDFLTLGFLKKVKWLSHIYLPFYRLFSLVTLSFLYRPIYYNLIDNKFGRWVGFLLVPYVAVVGFLLSEKIHSHVWYPDKPGRTALLNNHYDEQRTEKTLITTGSIPSKFVENGFLELFLAYIPKQDNRSLEKLCPDFEPFFEPGFETDLEFSVNGETPPPRTNAPDTALACFSQLYEIRIGDSLFLDNKYRFHRHTNYNEYGLVTILDVGYLPRGEHLLDVKKLGRKIADGQLRDTVVSFFQIPFWKE
jgi:hypothetical protein